MSDDRVIDGYESEMEGHDGYETEIGKPYAPRPIRDRMAPEFSEENMKRRSAPPNPHHHQLTQDEISQMADRYAKHRA